MRRPLPLIASSTVTYRNAISGLQLDRSAGCFPARMAASHVPGVEAGVAQWSGPAAADVEPIAAVHDHRLHLREVGHPFLYPLRVAPGRADGDLLDARDGVLRAAVDELQRLAGGEHRAYT